MRLIIMIAALLLVGGFIFWKQSSGAEKQQQKAGYTNTKNEKKSKKGNNSPTSDVTITKQWDLPPVLKEVSGIVYLDANRFACIQDEQGSIFIYNTATKQIEQEIPFATPGDYEDLAIKGNTAWVVRADGTLFEVDMTGNKSSTNQYKTHLTVKHNIEGLTFDAKANRLLLAIKDDEPGQKNYKGIYAFDLVKKTLAAEPVIRLEMNDPIVQSSKSKKSKAFKPSAIGIHPTTHEMYITDGTRSMLLILDASGNYSRLLQLGKAFEQPEGISFGKNGEVYISNEGTRQPGNIMQIAIPAP